MAPTCQQMAWVIQTMTPPGVEHAVLSALVKGAHAVIQTMTPPGVEHSSTRTSSTTCRLGDPDDDASGR